MPAFCTYIYSFHRCVTDWEAHEACTIRSAQGDRLVAAEQHIHTTYILWHLQGTTMLGVNGGKFSPEKVNRQGIAHGLTYAV